MAYYPRKEYKSLVDVQKAFKPRYYSVVLKHKVLTDNPAIYREVYYVYDCMGEYVHTAIVRTKPAE